jgi:hypothetical protein
VTTSMDNNKKAAILRAAKEELNRHSWDTFVENPPSVAQGGMGHVTMGCVACGKRINTVNQFVQHLADDVLPVILRRVFAIASVE